MNPVPKTVSVTELRSKTREVIRQAMESDEPIYIIYNSKMPVCLINTKYVPASSPLTATRQTPTGSQKRRNLGKFVGHLKDSQAFAEGALEYQRRIRAEWDRPRDSGEK